MKSESGGKFIRNYVFCYEQFTVFTKNLVNDFDYINRNYIHSQRIPTLIERSINSFKQSFFDQLKDDLLKAVLDEVE